MKNKIISVVNSVNFKNELKNNVNVFINGGYELLIRNIVLGGLRTKFPSESYMSEVPFKNNGGKVIMDLVRYDSSGEIVEICDFGHNGTFQTQTLRIGLINKTKSDINKYVSRGFKRVNTFGILTDIKYIKNNNLLVHYKENIIKNIVNSKKRGVKIDTVKNYLENMELTNGNILFHKSFPIVTEEINIEPHIFICGSYSSLV